MYPISEINFVVYCKGMCSTRRDESIAYILCFVSHTVKVIFAWKDG